MWSIKNHVLSLRTNYNIPCSIFSSTSPYCMRRLTLILPSYSWPSFSMVTIFSPVFYLLVPFPPFPHSPYLSPLIHLHTPFLPYYLFTLLSSLSLPPWSRLLSPSILVSLVSGLLSDSTSARSRFANIARKRRRHAEIMTVYSCSSDPRVQNFQLSS